MILPAGFARAVAPLEGALAQLAAGATLEGVVQAQTGDGKFRVNVAGLPLDLETSLALTPRERVQFVVRSTAPLTLEISRPTVAATPPEARLLPRGLGAELEGAVRTFAGDGTEAAAREAAARWMASRGLGIDPRLAAGLASLAARPGGATELAERINAALGEIGAQIPAGTTLGLEFVRSVPQVSTTNQALALFLNAFHNPPDVPAMTRPALQAGVEALSAIPGAAALGDAAASPSHRDTIRQHPLAQPAIDAAQAATELVDRAAAARLLSAESAARGEKTTVVDLVWFAQGRFEGATARVTRRPGGRPGEPESHGIAVVLSLSQLGRVRASLDLAGGAGVASFVVADRRARRAMEQGRRGLVEALVRLGLRAEVRVTEGAVEPLLGLIDPHLDLLG